MTDRRDRRPRRVALSESERAGRKIYVDSDEFLDMGGSRSRSWYPGTPHLIPLWRFLRRLGFPRLAELLR